jgi:hypothetical protein
MASVPCPFVYADGKPCPGHIVRIEGYKADVAWRLDEKGDWCLDVDPRSHYHLFCSEKGNHAGYRKLDDPRMKGFYHQLPEVVQKVVGAPARITVSD